MELRFSLAFCDDIIFLRENGFQYKRAKMCTLSINIFYQVHCFFQGNASYYNNQGCFGVVYLI